MTRSFQFRLLTFATLVLGATACDLLITEPAPASHGLDVSFAIEAASNDGITDAFDRVDRVYLRFTRADSAQRDTILAVANRDGEARARLVLDPNERIAALGVYAELRAGQVGLFQGARVIRVENGTATSAEISLTPIPAAIQASPSQVTFQTVGDTVHLTSAILFASGDTIPGVTGSWASEDASVVAVSAGGIALARGVGQTRLQVRYGTLTSLVNVQVLHR